MYGYIWPKWNMRVKKKNKAWKLIYLQKSKTLGTWHKKKTNKKLGKRNTLIWNWEKETHKYEIGKKKHTCRAKRGSAQSPRHCMVYKIWMIVKWCC